MVSHKFSGSAKLAGVSVGAAKVPPRPAAARPRRLEGTWRHDFVKPVFERNFRGLDGKTGLESDATSPPLLTRRKVNLYVSAVAQVAELVDALASGASGCKVVKVRVLSWAPFASQMVLS